MVPGPLSWYEGGGRHLPALVITVRAWGREEASHCTFWFSDALGTQLLKLCVPISWMWKQVKGVCPGRASRTGRREPALLGGWGTP